ncbi:hypothetical protein HDU79_011742 [Rhizoclosmatium sp. JEL0117]|nr:hypothetical protein HDU79_011742 [Rhizoclosmatium sp. JEL0117]
MLVHLFLIFGGTSAFASVIPNNESVQVPQNLNARNPLPTSECRILHNAWPDAFPEDDDRSCWTKQGITVEFGLITKISLAQATNIIGSIPDLSSFQALTYIDLSKTNLNDIFPKLPPQLEYLDLSYLNIIGGISSFPPGLIELHLYGNHEMNGPIPAFPDHIAHIEIARNKMTGELPILPPSITSLYEHSITPTVAESIEPVSSSVPMSISSSTMSVTYNFPSSSSLLTSQSTSYDSMTTTPASVQTATVKTSMLNTANSLTTGQPSSSMSLSVNTQTTSLKPTVSIVASCSNKTPSDELLDISKNIPSSSVGTTVKYSSEAASTLGTLVKLVPETLLSMGAVQTAQIFEVFDITSGKAVTFPGAQFSDGVTNYVVVMIKSDQYKFKSASEVAAYDSTVCSVTFDTTTLPDGSGVSFSYKFDGAIKSEWFAFKLSPDSTRLIISINTDHTVLASIEYYVTPMKTGDDGKYGFVVVNGVGSLVSGSIVTATSTWSTKLQSLSSKSFMLERTSMFDTEKSVATSSKAATTEADITTAIVSVPTTTTIKITATSSIKTAVVSVPTTTTSTRIVPNVMASGTVSFGPALGLVLSVYLSFFLL